MMMTRVRESSRFSTCHLLGELVGETDTRYIYRRRHSSQTTFVEKDSPLIHVEPCEACPDYRKPTAEGTNKAQRDWDGASPDQGWHDEQERLMDRTCPARRRGFSF